MKKFEDIDANLCTFCGTCVGVCPKNALSVKNEKVRLEGECISCGLCYSACPGIEVNFEEMNKLFFGEHAKNDYIGCYKSIFAAHSEKNEIRENGSSGGVVTSLLLHLLDKGLIDGAVLVGTDSKKPWNYEVKIARTRDEIIESSQSKYTLVPLNSILRKISEENGNFAVVGLPCHIHGIRKLQALGWAHSNKIKLLIGLFCGFNMRFSATEDLIKKLGVDKEDVINLQYRGGSYPGGFSLKTADHEKSLDKSYYNILNLLYVPERCLLCIDLMNELADISIGDIWRKNIKGGWSSVIIRNEIGRKMFNQAADDDYIVYEEISEDALSRSHAHLIKHKKKDIFLRMKLKKAKPEYYIKDYPLIKKQEQISGVFTTLVIATSQSSFMRYFFRKVPLKIIGIGANVITYFIRK